MQNTSSKGSMTIWVVAIIIVTIVLVLGIWWFFSQQNTYTSNNLGDGTTQTQSSAKSIISFNFEGLSPEVDGTVDSVNNAVSLTVPAGTDVTNLTPTIVVSDNATVSPDSGAAQDFTNPVTYTVVAQDGSTQTYTVTVTVAGTTGTTTGQ